MVSYQEIIAHLEDLADSEIAAHSQRFFKTGKGEYGYGDKFLGIRVPILRKAAKLFQYASETEITKLLKSEYHEVRLLSLLILVGQFSRGSEDEKELIQSNPPKRKKGT